jgi:hypothetical protein
MEKEDIPATKKLTEVEITNENIALNVLIQFLGVAQKRGTFMIDESSKIWECIQKFQKPPEQQQQQQASV